MVDSHPAADDGELGEFDADVEREQCQHRGAALQPEIVQDAGEGEAVHETERDGDHGLAAAHEGADGVHR